MPRTPRFRIPGINAPATDAAADARRGDERKTDERKPDARSADRQPEPRQDSIQPRPPSRFGFAAFRATPEQRQAAMEKQGEMEKRVEQIRSVFNEYDSAVCADGYRCSLINWKSEKSPPDYFKTDKNEKAVAFSPQDVREKYVPAMAMRTGQNKFENAYYWPISARTHHVLIDDMTAANLERMKSDGYSPAVVIKSNAGDNFQAIINVRKTAGDDDLDRKIGNRLAVELNQKYGDPQINHSSQAHRAPGFTNQKPKHRDPVTNDGPPVVLIEAKGGICPKAAGHYEDARSQIEAEERLAHERLERRRGQRLVNPDRARPPPDDLNSAYKAFRLHAENVIEHQKSGLDYQGAWIFRAAQRMAVTGWTDKQIIAAIQNEGPEIDPNAGRSWEREAAGIVDKFRETNNLAELEKLAIQHKPRWVRAENQGGARTRRDAVKQDASSGERVLDRKPGRQQAVEPKPDAEAEIREQKRRAAEEWQRQSERGIDIPPPGY